MGTSYPRSKCGDLGVRVCPRTPGCYSECVGLVMEKRSVPETPAPYGIFLTPMACACCSAPEWAGADHVGPVYCAECLTNGHDRGDS